jgi:hypothetical protein
MKLTRRELLAAAAAATQLRATAKMDLYEIAAEHVQLADESKDKHKLWGRIGGSDAERASAKLLAEQLQIAVGEAHTEPFNFDAHRPLDWSVIAGDVKLESAMPAPFDARFPSSVEAPLVALGVDGSWDEAKGKWILLQPTEGVTASLPVREKLLYQKAVKAQAAGFVFAIPTPPDVPFRAVVPVDKPYSLKDERYPDGVRPIPCFAIDTADANRLKDAKSLKATISYSPKMAQSALNAVAKLHGPAERHILFFAHLDSFFSGACDNASGLATLVGIAQHLAQVPEALRKATFWFLGQAAHHDCAAGTRAFMENQVRWNAMTELIQIEHVDAVDTKEGKQWGWPAPLNNRRTAFVGPQGWSAVEQALPKLVRQSRVMSVDPKIEKGCIADLFVSCGKKQGFCLIQSPPFYHTDHDNMDKISRGGIQRAVNFHLALLRTINAVA